MMTNKRVLGAVLLAGALAGGCVGADPGVPGAVAEAPLDASTSDCLAALAAGRDVIPGRFIVSFRTDRLSPLAADRDLAVTAALGARKSYFEIGVANAVAVDLSDAEAARLRADPRVAYVEPDRLACALDDADTEGGKAKPVPPPAPACANGDGETIPSGIAAILAPHPELTGAGVTVAVVDTGIDSDHPDLATSIVGGTSFIARTTSEDDHGHGTHVAGTIAGIDNAIGVLGVAPGSDLLAVKVLDRRGSGSMSAVAAGIQWAVDNGADVINLSLGGGGHETLRTAVANAHAAGVFVAVAAGNEAASATGSYPGAYDDFVITVSAWDDLGAAFASFSNYGVPPIDIAAPGVGVCSTTRGGGYGLKSGTSMATPHVAGAAALAIERARAAGTSTAPFDLRDAFIAGATVLTNVGDHTEDLLNVSGL